LAASREGGQTVGELQAKVTYDEQGSVDLTVTNVNGIFGGTPRLVVPGLVLTHSCDVDKFDKLKPNVAGNERKRYPLTVAPLLPAAEFSNGVIGDIRAGRHKRFFLLPAEEGHPAMVADLWSMQQVPLLEVKRLKREATLSPEHLAKLHVHLFVLFSHRNPDEVFTGGRLAP
jgi:hypothetical protein